MRQTSQMVLIRKRNGYTLIEMMVIVVLLALFSAMVAPNLIAMRDSQQRRALYTEVADLAGTARELAISNSATMYLTVDQTSNALVLKQEDDTSTYQNTANGGAAGDTVVIDGHVQSTRTKTNIGTNSLDHSNDKTVKTLPLTSGVQFGNFQLAGSATDSGSWKLHFYADGSTDGGGFEMVDRGQTKSVVVNAHGGTQLNDGTLPDASQEKWTAGDYVHRQ